jgi:hypothetical protein
MTGVVVARRAPVWFDRYDQVHGGHVASEERPPCAVSSACPWSGAGASSGHASCSAGTNGAYSGRMTRNCSNCSPGTRRRARDRPHA